jgi:hypothetical protein
MEREIQIKMIGNQEEKIKDDLRPLVTFTEDSSDEDKSSECAEGFSIEELERALFSKSKEGLVNLKNKLIMKILFLDLPSNMKVVEPEPEVSEDLVTGTETSRTKLYEERLIDILMEDWFRF